MSWNRKHYKDAYNRANHCKTLDGEQEDLCHAMDVWSDTDKNYYNDEMYPTVRSHAQGKLFKLLHKLNVRHAKAKLDEIYW